MFKMVMDMELYVQYISMQEVEEEIHLKAVWHVNGHVFESDPNLFDKGTHTVTFNHQFNIGFTLQKESDDYFPQQKTELQIVTLENLVVTCFDVDLGMICNGIGDEGKMIKQVITHDNRDDRQIDSEITYMYKVSIQQVTQWAIPNKQVQQPIQFIMDSQYVSNYKNPKLKYSLNFKSHHLQGQESQESNQIYDPVHVYIWCFNKSTIEGFSIDGEGETYQQLMSNKLEHKNLGRALLIHPQSQNIFAIGGNQNKKQVLMLQQQVIGNFKVSSKADTLQDRQASKACMLGNDYIVVTGGQDSANKGIKSCEIYSLQKDEWSKLPDLNQGRCQHSSCSLNGIVYVFCGSKDYDNVSEQNSIEICNTQEVDSTWKTLDLGSSFPQRTNHFSMQIDDSRILIFGGYQKADSLIFDVTKNKLYTTQNDILKSENIFMYYSIPVFDPSAQCVYAPCTSGGHFKGIYKYDVNSNTWSVLEYQQYEME